MIHSKTIAYNIRRREWLRLLLLSGAGYSDADVARYAHAVPDFRD